MIKSDFEWPLLNSTSNSYIAKKSKIANEPCLTLWQSPGLTGETDDSACRQTRHTSICDQAV